MAANPSADHSTDPATPSATMVWNVGTFTTSLASRRSPAAVALVPPPGRGSSPRSHVRAAREALASARVWNASRQPGTPRKLVGASSTPREFPVILPKLCAICTHPNAEPRVSSSL